MKNYQYAGLLGHYDLSLSESDNLKIIEANKLVDDYNQNVYSFQTNVEQMKYQNKIINIILKLLNSC